MQKLGRVDQYDIIPTPVTNTYSEVSIKSYIRKLKSEIDSLPRGKFRENMRPNSFKSLSHPMLPLILLKTDFC